MQTNKLIALAVCCRQALPIPIPTGVSLQFLQKIERYNLSSKTTENILVKVTDKEQESEWYVEAR